MLKSQEIYIIISRVNQFARGKQKKRYQFGIPALQVTIEKKQVISNLIRQKKQQRWKAL